MSVCVLVSVVVVMGGEGTQLPCPTRLPPHSSAELLIPASSPASSRTCPPRPPPGWLVLSIPRGTFRLEAPLTITRPRTVLRGAGSARTKLYVPRSLMQLYGERRGWLAWRGRVEVGGSESAGNGRGRLPLCLPSLPPCLPAH